MKNIEKTSGKIAAALCVASCLPVVATVYASTTQDGWHGDKYLEDKKLAKGWVTIDGDEYYFDETSGELDVIKTAEAFHFKEEAINTANNLVALADTTPVVEEVAAPEEETQEVSEDDFDRLYWASQETEPALDANTALITPEQTPVVEEVVAPVETPVVEVQPEAPVVPEVPVQPEAPIVEAPIIEEVQPEVPVVPETPVQPEAPVIPEAPVVPETPVQPEAPVVPEVPSTPEVSDPYAQYAALNQAIVDAALKLVDTTNGWQCTEVVAKAMADAGVYDAGTWWPREYASVYGEYTNNPQPGNLIFYDNGGDGVDHIAIYIGNGLAVHGNYWMNGKSYTVVADAVIPGSGAPQYIQVMR